MYSFRRYNAPVDPAQHLHREVRLEPALAPQDIISYYIISYHIISYTGLSIPPSTSIGRYGSSRHLRPRIRSGSPYRPPAPTCQRF